MAPPPLPQFTIYLSYSYGNDSAEFFDIYQSNNLSNNDELLSSDAAGIPLAYNTDVSELLLELVDEAQKSLEELSVNPFDHSLEEIAQMMQAAGEQAIIDGEYELENPPGEQPEAIEGKYINGIKQPEETELTGASDEESHDDDDSAHGLEDDGPDDGTAEAGQGVDADVESLYVVTNPNEPTGGAAQIAELGTNEATNTAVMVDWSDSYGSIIVQGDVFSTNAIIQANILYDNDEIAFSGVGLVGEASGDGNVTENIAEFTFDNTSVAGNPALGNLPVGLNWNVDYIEGDVYDISMVVQENYLIDNDIVQQTATNTHFMATTGIRRGLFSTNAIIQANILYDNDEIAFSGVGLVGEASGDGNVTENIAEFTFDNTSVAGNPALGNLPVGLNWNVDYIEGDVYDISMVVQENYLIDNDIVQQTATNTHFMAATGANSQTNQLSLFEYGTTYDLIIVGGNSYEFNVIVQYNVLLDNDILQLYADGSADSSMAANAGGNVLTNDASIVNIGGGDRFNPMGEEAATLAELVGNEATEFDSELANEINGNGSNTLNVLYITGDLYDLHAIYQMNVMTDIDFAQLEMDIDEEGDNDGPDEFSQEVSSGGNELTNTAIIYDVDSTSNYQFLGGQFYEDSLLIQTEMVTNDDEISFDDQTELVATTVAILTGGSEDASALLDDNGPETTGPGGEDDVMGGVMS